MHDPARVEAVRAVRVRGGAAAGKVRALERRRSRLSTPAKLIAFTATVVHDVIDDRVPVDAARVAIYGVSVLRQLIEAGALVARLEALETALKMRKNV